MSPAPRRAQLSVVPQSKRSKIAILGFTPHRALAPFKDPAWEIWGINDLYLDLAEIPQDRLRWFQLHEWNAKLATAAGEMPSPPCPRDPEHVLWLQHHAKNFPIYLAETRAEVPEAVLLPKDQLRDFFGSNYFTNSVSWMLGLAIMELIPDGSPVPGSPRYNPKARAVEGAELAVYGVDMMTAGGQGSEYGWQRPSCEWLLGVAMGAGIKVTLPPQSDLMKTAFAYGDAVGNAFREKVKAQRFDLSTRRGQFTEQRDQAMYAIAELTGAINTLDHILGAWMPGDSGEPSLGRVPLPDSHKPLTPVAPPVATTFDG